MDRGGPWHDASKAGERAAACELNDRRLSSNECKKYVIRVFIIKRAYLSSRQNLLLKLELRAFFLLFRKVKTG